MSNRGPTQEKYDSLIYKLATLESELGQARKLLEAPPKKPGWWKRLFSPYIVVLVLAVLLLPTASRALTVYQEALVGLKGVRVTVEIDPQAKRLGLTKAQIKTDVELRLRKAGVMVLTEEEWLETPGRPWLWVNVSTYSRREIPLVAYTIRVELGETVTLARGFETPGGIWSAAIVGSVGESKIREIRNNLSDAVDEFINDYLAANPKK